MPTQETNSRTNTTIEFGSLSAANAARADYSEWLCPDDDKRLKTVRFVSDVPADVIERAELQAVDSLDEHESGPGQLELTERERDEIDFSSNRASVPHARAVKAIARDEGVDDWLAFYDDSLTVDEHREVMARAARDEQGKRIDEEESAIEKAGRASRSAQANECDHARDHCEHGDPDACEFLSNRCGYDPDEVEQMLSPREEASEGAEQEFTDEQAGAYHRSLSGYKGAVAALRELLDAVQEQRRNAEQAWSAMAAIRRDTGREIEEPEQLHDLLDGLQDALDAHRRSTVHETTTE